ncbi:MAG: type II toxin-antitoxin system prevent-host-death family antitoxin [Gemmatimonadota bacterium]|nr:type II toxin-antitoxin system prevent-host-death family antitoxin [Gemmatimonadota bacterium]
MRTVGIRELKAHLSAVLREVQRGDVVLVTDRGRVVAELRAPGAPGLPPVGRGTTGITRLARAGHLRVAEPSSTPYPRSPITSPPGLARMLLDAERDER